jgi:hypothetical protein
MKTLPQTFRTTDGKDFQDKDAAERHETLIEAKEAYVQARRLFGKLLAETQLTADGRRFEFGVFHTYYYIEPGFWGMPGLSEVPYLGWHWDFDDSDGFVIRYRDEKQNRDREFKIAELYSDRRIADKALLKAREARLAEYAAETASERARLYPDQASEAGSDQKGGSR